MDSSCRPHPHLLPALNSSSTPCLPNKTTYPTPYRFTHRQRTIVVRERGTHRRRSVRHHNGRGGRELVRRRKIPMRKHRRTSPEAILAHALPVGHVLGRRHGLLVGGFFNFFVFAVLLWKREVRSLGLLSSVAYLPPGLTRPRLILLRVSVCCLARARKRAREQRACGQLVLPQQWGPKTRGALLQGEQSLGQNLDVELLLWKAFLSNDGFTSSKFQILCSEIFLF